jgi:hypothetical protein
VTDTYKVGADGIRIITKSKAGVLDYPVDLLAEPPGPWLEDDETILSAVAVAEPGISVISATPTPIGAATRIVVWLEGGTIGVTYLVSVTFTTSKSRTDTRSFRVKVILR